MNSKLLTIAGAIIILLLGICTGVGAYYLVDVKERSERNTELNVVQDGDIKTINILLQQIDTKLGTLDSLQIVLTRMDAKLGILVNGY